MGCRDDRAGSEGCAEGSKGVERVVPGRRRERKKVTPRARNATLSNFRIVERQSPGG